MRKTALICAATVIVVGAVVGTVLVAQDDSSSGNRAATSSPRAAPSTTSPGSTTTPASDRFTLADAGLHRLVTRNRPTTARPVVPLTSCPFAPGVPLASTGLRAARVRRAGSRRGTVDVTDWTDSGDRGVAVTCRFTGPRKFYAAAYTHTRAVGRAPIPDYDGPIGFGGGRLYRSTDKTKCAAYWAPPSSDYVISIQFSAPEPVKAARCGAALRAVQPTIFRGLAKLGV